MIDMFLAPRGSIAISYGDGVKVILLRTIIGSGARDLMMRGQVCG